MNLWIMKQDGLRVGMTWNQEPDDWRDWIGLGGDVDWRGPSSPRDTVYHVPAGDLVVVWDVRERFVWEATVSLGRATVQSWYDHVDERTVRGPALWMIRIAAFPCEVPEDEVHAQTGRTTLHRVKPELGLDWLKRIVDAAVEDLGEDLR